LENNFSHIHACIFGETIETQETSFVLIAGVFTPHSFQIGCTNWAIREEDSV